MTLNDDEKAQLEARLQVVDQYKARVENSDEQPLRPYGREFLLSALVCIAVLFFWTWGVTERPIPTGKEYSDQAAVFLKEQYPDRVLTSRYEELHFVEDVTAPVAVVFHIIRSGEPRETTKAIEFAKIHEFGYATPYVIEWLESDDPQLRKAARSFLCWIAEDDYGPQAEAWNEWWNDPPKRVLGLAIVKESTLRLRVVVVLILVGMFLLIAGLMRKKRGAAAATGGTLLLLAWMMSINPTGYLFDRSPDYCQFGDVEIAYHQGHGNVYGLEDARVGGSGFLSLPGLLYFGIPVLLAMVVAVLELWWRSTKVTDPL